MSFRARITLAAAAAVAVAVAVVSVAVYLSASNALRGQVDDELRARAGEAVLRPTPSRASRSVSRRRRSASPARARRS